MCRNTGSYAPCNLFYHQLSKVGFKLDNSTIAPVGITPICGIPRAVNGRFGNIVNILICSLCFIFMIYLSQRANRRRAAVGRIELRGMLMLYAGSLLLQALTSGSLLEQGTLPLVILTVIHAAVIATVFWLLLANSLVATQFVEDGTPSALIPYYGLAGIFFLATAYIAADTAFGFTSLFKSDPPRDLRNIGLFILLIMWPMVSALLYFGIMAFISLRVLEEKKPFLWYLLALALFVGAQAGYFLLGTPICQATNRFLDSAFIATLLETASVVAIFMAWREMTESDWEDKVYLV